MRVIEWKSAEWHSGYGIVDIGCSMRMNSYYLFGRGRKQLHSGKKDDFLKLEAKRYFSICSWIQWVCSFRYHNMVKEIRDVGCMQLGKETNIPQVIFDDFRSMKWNVNYLAQPWAEEVEILSGTDFHSMIRSRIDGDRFVIMYLTIMPLSTITITRACFLTLREWTSDFHWDWAFQLLNWPFPQRSAPWYGPIRWNAGISWRGIER